MTSADPANPSASAVEAWEAAYLRFESPAAEERKFLRRLTSVGARHWRRDALILDLFCGRGGGARALYRLGFDNVVGLDLSPRLLRERADSSSCLVADCRELPVAAGSVDIAVVQGGLHHLPTIPEDLSAVLSEVARTLRPSGLLFVVEPWRTPFLNIVHRACDIPLARRVVGKLDALATMIEYERDTYEAWLRSGPVILDELDRHFERRHIRRRWGKLYYLGSPRIA